MNYNTSSLYASVELFLVLTSSIVNGPIVDFSASLQLTRSFSGGIFVWGESTHSIASIDRLTVVSESLSGSNVVNYIFALSQSSHVNLNNELASIYSSFASGSDLSAKFPPLGITLS